MNKNFTSLMVEAGNYRKLTFGEKGYRNYLGKAKRLWLWLGKGDTEAIRKYFVRIGTKNTNIWYHIE